MRNGGLQRKALGAFAVGAALALALGGCSTVGGDDQQAKAGAGSDSLATKLLMGNANPPPAQPRTDDTIKTDCPPIDVLDGAAAYRVYATPGSSDPFDIRYQASIADTARECSSLGVEAAIRVGLTGRLITGPKGGPGSVRLPLRIAVVDDRNTPLYSQLHMIDVTIPAGQTQTEFPHIEENIVVPIPQNRFRGWRILVGYDPKGAEAPAKTARRR